MKKNENNIKTYSINEIDELSIGWFIIKQEIENDVCNKINKLGGRVISSMRAQGGYSLSTLFDIFSDVKNDYVVVFSALRKEDSRNIVEAINVEFNFDKQGVGKAFIVDVEGYMGAKGPFLK